MRFFTNTKLLVAKDLPKGQKYHQNYFISDICPELEREKMRYKRRKQDGTFSWTWHIQKVIRAGKSRENSTRKASYALQVHLILLI
jgi:hypothetical protein